MAAIAGLVLTTPARAQDEDYTTLASPFDPTWTLNVHVIGSSMMDVSGDFGSTAIDGDDARLNGWGIEGAALGERFTLLIGFEERTLQTDVDFLEVYGGTKLNLFRRGAWAPYLIGTVRYSQDLEFPTMPATASDDFFGWSAGAGLEYHANERFFLEARVVYEGLFEDIDARMGREIAFRGPIAVFGAGFKF